MKNLHLGTYLALTAIGKKKIVSLLVAVLMVVSFAVVSYAANSPATGYNATGIYAWRWTRTDIAIGVYADPGLYQWIGSWNPGTQVWIERRLDNVKTSAGDTVSIAETGGAFGHKYAYVRAAELIVTPQTASSSSGINVSAAVEYANKYYTNYNSRYYNCNSIGGDCANFVSQCLYAGGMKTDSTWYPGSDSTKAHSSAWQYCPSLYSYLKSKGWRTVSSVTAGCVVFYSKSGKTGSSNYDHVSFGVGNGLVNAHNNDRKGVNWKMYNVYEILQSP